MKKLIFLFVVCLIGCQSNNLNQKPDDEMKKIETSIINEASEEWMKWDGVEAVGQGKTKDDKDCIVVFVSGDSVQIKKKLPARYKGYRVEVRNIGGKIDAQ
jgi:hypothetical protein